MEIAIMIEGQNGLNWKRWQNIARTVEDLGFVGLYRSDHFTNANPPDKDSLELWVSLTWLASHTTRIEFGPLVSPFSFRHPALTARMAAAIDDLSGGRLTLGVGAGWQEREHHLFDFPLLEIGGRFKRFEEGLEALTRLLGQEDPVDFAGDYYNLRGATLLPRPQRVSGPPLLIGGNGRYRTLKLTARYADEWNAIFLTPEKFSKLNRTLDEYLKQEKRAPSEVRRSMMTGLIFGQNQAAIQAQAAARNTSSEALRARGLIVGTGEEIQSQLKEYQKSGLQRIMLQWLDLDDLKGLEELAKQVL